MRIFHNPRCSKSRQCLALLESSGVDYEVIRYLESPPSQSDVASVLSRLDSPPITAIRTNEQEWRNLTEQPDNEDDVALAALISRFPLLLQRPIVDDGSIARICRPPERVVELL